MKYQPFGKGWTVFGFTDCLTQSLHLLDIAASIATETGDTNALIDLSREWLNVYARVEKIGPDLDEEEEEEELLQDKKKQPLGFGLGEKPGEVKDE